MEYCRANDWSYFLTGLDGVWGVVLVLKGEMRAGIQWLEKSIQRRDQEGYHRAASWYRMFLCETYLEIISGSERPPIGIIAKNLVILTQVFVTAEADFRVDRDGAANPGI